MEDELGAVGGGGVSAVHSQWFHVEPFRPGPVILLGADEGGDITLTGPGQGEHGEGLRALELLHGPGAGVLTLGGDGRVLDQNIRSAVEAGGFVHDLDRVHGGALCADVVGVGCYKAGGHERDSQECGECRFAPDGVDAASLLHDKFSLMMWCG